MIKIIDSSEIESKKQEVRYDTKEYTIEIVVQKFLNGLEDDDNEFYVPDYQREFTWDEIRQSKFIESLLVGLPIPFIFLAQDSNKRYEIVDGSQRIRTLSAFLKDNLELKGLDILPSLNGCKFSHFEKPYQREFNNISLKMITLSSQTSDETKVEIFKRINRGSDLLKDMEARKGIYRGRFNDFIYHIAQNEKFIKLTPIEKWFANRQEREELLLRFFFFKEQYPNYKDTPGIARQLDEYFKEKNTVGSFTESDEVSFRNSFNKMLDFVEKTCPHGFSKQGNKQISRVYFEALSVGVVLALCEDSSLKISVEAMRSILTSNEFKEKLSLKYHTHKSNKIISRINFVKDELLQYANIPK